MKRRNFVSNLSMIGIASALGITASEARGRGRKRGGNTTLTEAQKADIFYMYQEEKVARDVYITLGNIYTDERTFASIQLSEQRHIDAVENLCNKYGIDLSGVNEQDVGNFVLPALQEYYDDMIARGDTLIGALEVGREIEVKDIEDLETAMVGMPQDVQNVFGNLREGSLNHLEAFETAIDRVL